MIDAAFLAPRWATRGGDPFEVRQRNRIDPRAFTDFAVAIQRRYSGRFALPRARDPLPRVAVFHVPEAGRGRALTRAWLGSEADVSVYMDIDLSTGLEALPPLIDAIATGRADIASGTRLGPLRSQQSKKPAPAMLLAGRAELG